MRRHSIVHGVRIGEWLRLDLMLRVMVRAEVRQRAKVRVRATGRPGVRGVRKEGYDQRVPCPRMLLTLFG